MPQNYTDDGKVREVPSDLGATSIVEHSQEAGGSWGDFSSEHGDRDFSDAPKGSRGSRGKVAKNRKGTVDTDFPAGAPTG